MNIRERKARQKKNANHSLQHVRTDSWYMVHEKRFESFMTEVLDFVEQIIELVSIPQELPSGRS